MPVVSYRCVCGETIPLDTAEGGSCANCDRHYAPDVLQNAFAETVQIDIDGEAASQGASSPAEDERIGKTLGHYEIVSRLGEGGMGSVYRALDKSLQRYVALKVIRSGAKSSTDTRQLQRLFQEAIAQARVNHPNVVHIYYVGRDDQSPFLAMELVDGITVGDRLAAGPLPFAEVVDIAIQVVDALSHSVNFDILHGDIKPSNILMTRNGTAKLSDFGLARRLSQAADSGSEVAGTPVYMAPEAVASDAVDIRSDMYALGVTLFEMTFGRLPYTFDGSTVAACLETHRTAAVEFPDVWPVEVPSGWQELLAKLLAKSPDDRFHTYDELLLALQALRPARLPKAGRVQRGLAWLVDLALVNVALQTLTNPLVSEELSRVLAGRVLVTPLVLLVGAAAPLLASAVQAYWGLTPGKKLFQIRVVDRHGLRPSQATLAARMVFQMLPLWAAVVGLGLQQLGAILFVVFAALAFGVTMIVDLAMALIRRDGRSLHDILFDTYVVLDVSAAVEGSQRSHFAERS